MSTFRPSSWKPWPENTTWNALLISKHCIYSSVLSSSLQTKDLPWYAPQNQILLLPWIWSSSSEAFDAATDGTGWPVDHLSKVWSGAWFGLSVTRKGWPFSSIFCSKIQYLNNRIDRGIWAYYLFLTYKLWDLITNKPEAHSASMSGRLHCQYFLRNSMHSMLLSFGA